MKLELGSGFCLSFFALLFHFEILFLQLNRVIVSCKVAIDEAT